MAHIFEFVNLLSFSMNNACLEVCVLTLLIILSSINPIEIDFNLIIVPIILLAYFLNLIIVIMLSTFYVQE